MDGNAFEIWENASIVHANLAPAFIHRLVGGIWRGGSMHVLLFSIHTKICFVKVDHSTAEHFPAYVFQRGFHPRLARIEEVDQGAGPMHPFAEVKFCKGIIGIRRLCKSCLDSHGSSGTLFRLGI